MQKLWYAVQNESQDAWDYGSYDLQEAKEMAKQAGAKLLAVIENAETDPFCVDEIYI